jgi:PKHD-type hydroxylase
MNQFWLWEKAIPKELCEFLKVEFDRFNPGKGTVYGNHSEEQLEKIRKCKTAFAHPNHWIEGVLFNHIRYANQSAGWNFDIDGIQPVQLTKYDGSEFYDWHTDDDVLSRREPNQRKLTAVLLLSAPDEYEGGGLFVKGMDQSLIVNQGDLVVFPSFLEHTAKAVTSGTRMTAVGWSTGPYFK